MYVELLETYSEEYREGSSVKLLLISTRDNITRYLLHNGSASNSLAQV